MLRYTSAIVVALGALVAGCSDANGPGAVDLPEAVVAGRLEHGTLRSIGANTNAAIIPGDDASGIAYRSTLGFDLGALPAGAKVTAATLQVDQCRVGGAPFTALGALVLDHIDLTLGLTDAAYAGQTIDADVGTLSSDATIGMRQLDVTTQVQQDVASHRRVTAYRLRFSQHDTNGDAVTDFVQIALSRDGVCTSAPEPKLHVAYSR
ncbi:MAG: hypothetical protein HOQ11_01515 [Gemmatimonadaceae bacterium]|nr:hypothetical protein [Gemmatimonadaceae bacterium]NUQ93360.1 hypothetical protein [Gemmatimonadaceae bacterium]NUR35355.1 hypothetical protein [Gemmatimonadaceae bacterium]NUS96067.1 hypothetical protein [Gemmatimonadaceae bacterium]